MEGPFNGGRAGKVGSVFTSLPCSPRSSQPSPQPKTWQPLSPRRQGAGRFKAIANDHHHSERF
eukprot:6458862-Amphidinium_carterae.1